MTETMLAESVEKDPRVTELSRNSRLHRNAKSSFQQAAEAMGLLNERMSNLLDPLVEAPHDRFQARQLLTIVGATVAVANVRQQAKTAIDKELTTIQEKLKGTGLENVGKDLSGSSDKSIGGSTDRKKKGK
jgi:hypothetical protein